MILSVNLTGGEPPHDKTNKMVFVPSEDSDQPGHLLTLIRVFAVHLVGSWGPSVSSCGQRKLWSDWTDAQADLSLRWAQRPFCLFCYEAPYSVVYLATYQSVKKNYITFPDLLILSINYFSKFWISHCRLQVHCLVCCDNQAEGNSAPVSPQQHRATGFL